MTALNISFSVPLVGGLGGALRTGEKPECFGLGGEGTRDGRSAADGGKSVGWGQPLRRFIGAVF